MPTTPSASECRDFGRKIALTARRIALAAFLVSSCSESTPAAPAADLPTGWQTAKAVASFTQASCNGSPLDPAPPPETLEVMATPGRIEVAYHHAHFRCEQTVEAFVRIGSSATDFLVQPVDMNPSNVTRCDCLYEITMAADVSTGATTVTVYRRWDHLGGNPSDPVEVGTASVTVP